MLFVHSRVPLQPLLVQSQGEHEQQSADPHIQPQGLHHCTQGRHQVQSMDQLSYSTLKRAHTRTRDLVLKLITYNLQQLKKILCTQLPT